MKSRPLAILSVLLLLGLAGHFFMNVLTLREPGSSTMRLDPLEVRYTEVRHQGTGYPLNFTQQNQIVAAVNHAKIAGDLQDLDAVGVESITVFPFEGKPQLLELDGSEGNRIVFRCQSLDGGKQMIEAKSGLKEMLAETYDAK